MIQVVLDTNVVAAAMLSSRGASHRLLRLIGDSRWQINLSVPLVLEYEQTLQRVCRSPVFSLQDIEDLLAYLCSTANLHPIYYLWRPLLPDAGDDMVLELAVESRSEFIVTFNLKDLVPAERFGIRVVTPSKFLVILEQGL